MENIVDDQDTPSKPNEDNLILKERLFFAEKEFKDRRMWLQCFDAIEWLIEEVVEDDSENERESRVYGRSM